MGRARNGSISAQVDVDVSDVLEDLSDEDLLEELAYRKRSAAPDVLTAVVLFVVMAAFCVVMLAGGKA